MKKKFRFRLEAVERVRRAKEQEMLRALAYAQTKYRETLLAKQALMEETNVALARRQSLAEKSQTIVAYQLETEFIVGNKQRMIQSDQAIFRARKFVEKALREMLVAKRALRAIEMLREKAYAEFKIEMRKKEQKELEDLYTSRSRAFPLDTDETDASESVEWSESA
jgi:flagellar export protein FliJ